LPEAWVPVSDSEFAGTAGEDEDDDDGVARGMEETTRSCESGRDGVYAECEDECAAVDGSVEGNGDWLIRSEEHSTEEGADALLVVVVISWREGDAGEVRTGGWDTGRSG
jgi:hypothetical protein